MSRRARTLLLALLLLSPGGPGCSSAGKELCNEFSLSWSARLATDCIPNVFERILHDEVLKNLRCDSVLGVLDAQSFRESCLPGLAKLSCAELLAMKLPESCTQQFFYDPPTPY